MSSGTSRDLARQHPLPTTIDDPRAELLDEVKAALVDEINRQQLVKFGRTGGLICAQEVFDLVDMDALAEIALDAVQDRVALEIAKGLTLLRSAGLSGPKPTE